MCACVHGCMCCFFLVGFCEGLGCAEVKGNTSRVDATIGQRRDRDGKSGEAGGEGAMRSRVKVRPPVEGGEDFLWSTKLGYRSLRRQDGAFEGF